VEAGYKPQVIMSLWPGNVEEIEPLVHWAIEAGCGSVKFNIIQATGRGAQMAERESLLTIEELLRLGRWVEKELRNSVSIPLFYSWPMAFHGIGRLRRSLGETCHIHHILGILSTGELAMCGIGVQEEDLVYGRLGADNVAEIWTSHPVLLGLRDLIPAQLEGICGKCMLRDRCLGCCVAQTYYGNGSLTAPFWFCRMADEVGLFPSSRRREPAALFALTRAI